MIKKLPLSFVVLCALFALPFVSYPVQASGSNSAIIGNWAAPDLGPGGHAGGPIYASGVLGGGGHVSLFQGTEEGQLTKAAWTFSPESTTQHPLLDICLFVTPTTPSKDPLGIFGHPFCFQNLPANTGPFNLTLPDGFTTHFVLHIRT